MEQRAESTTTESAADCESYQPNQGVQATAYSVRYAPASRRA